MLNENPWETTAESVLSSLSIDMGSPPPKELVKLFARNIENGPLIDPLFAGWSMAKPDNHSVVEAIAKQVLPEQKVLDCGSGIGRYSFLAGGQGANVISIELNPAFCRFQQWLNSREHLISRILTQDFMEIEDSNFDHILCLFTSLPDNSEGGLLRFFEWARNHLADNGVLWFDVIPREEFYNWFQEVTVSHWTPWGELKESADFNSLTGKVSLSWKWHLNSGPQFAKSYNFILPSSGDIVRTAQQSGWHAEKISPTHFHLRQDFGAK